MTKKLTEKIDFRISPGQKIKIKHICDKMGIWVWPYLKVLIDKKIDEYEKKNWIIK